MKTLQIQSHSCGAMLDEMHKNVHPPVQAVVSTFIVSGSNVSLVVLKFYFPYFYITHKGIPARTQ